MRRLDVAGRAVRPVPGVPAFAAAAAALGRELTVPTVAQTVILTRMSALATPMPDGEDLSDAGPLRRHAGAAPPVHRIDEVVAQLTGVLRRRLPGRGGRAGQPPDEMMLRGHLVDIAAAAVHGPESGWPPS